MLYSILEMKIFLVLEHLGNHLFMYFTRTFFQKRGTFLLFFKNQIFQMFIRQVICEMQEMTN